MALTATPEFEVVPHAHSSIRFIGLPSKPGHAFVLFQAQASFPLVPNDRNGNVRISEGRASRDSTHRREDDSVNEVKKLLFICSRNQLRSLTAERMYQGFPGYAVKSAGTSPEWRSSFLMSPIGWTCKFAKAVLFAVRARLASCRPARAIFNETKLLVQGMVNTSENGEVWPEPELIWG
jgi:hypothetical protein